MAFPSWAGEDSRWRKLQIYDKLLDGQFYDHLPHHFYQEEDANGYIPLLERRPSCQFRIHRYIGKWAARKLFAGRHVPKIRAPNEATEKRISKLLTGTKIWPTMFEAAFRGSVGSVAVSFRIDGEKVGLKVWRAQWCSPHFDDFGELVLLRVHYCATGAALAAIGFGGLEPSRDYWFIRDYGPQEEVTYVPVQSDEWDPVRGFRDPGRKPSLTPAPNMVYPHGLGFVPGVWIMNPAGSGVPDGGALWEDAIPNTIEVDYLLSQAARGARYNCAPQLVTQGEVISSPGSQGTNPTTTLSFHAAHRDGKEGEMIGGGDAKLLEMQGTGAEAALKIIEMLKKLAQEQIGVVQKDPGEMPGPLSGRAMEFLDEDSHDTAMQWRTTYGEGGALALIAKMLRVLDPDIDVTTLWLQWPRIYQPTPGDLQAMVQALVMAITPIPVGEPKVSADGTAGEQPTMPPLMDAEIARSWLAANMDLGILDDTEGDTPAGPSGGVPDPSHGDDDGVMGEHGPFWRILPPIKMRNR